MLIPQMHSKLNAFYKFYILHTCMYVCMYHVSVIVFSKMFYLAREWPTQDPPLRLPRVLFFNTLTYIDSIHIYIHTLLLSLIIPSQHSLRSDPPLWSILIQQQFYSSFLVPVAMEVHPMAYPLRVVSHRRQQEQRYHIVRSGPKLI